MRDGLEWELIRRHDTHSPQFWFVLVCAHEAFGPRGGIQNFGKLRGRRNVTPTIGAGQRRLLTVTFVQ